MGAATGVPVIRDDALIDGSGAPSVANEPHVIGELHTKELEILVRYRGLTPLEAIFAATRHNALTVGLQNDIGVLQHAGLADILVLRKEPLADITVSQGGRNIARHIKNGNRIDRNRMASGQDSVQLQHAQARRRIQRKEYPKEEK